METVTHQNEGEHKRTVYRVASGRLSPTQSEYKSDILKTLSDMTIREQIIPEHNLGREKYNKWLNSQEINKQYVSNNKSIKSRPISESFRKHDYWQGESKPAVYIKPRRKTKSTASVISNTTLDLKYGDIRWIKPTYSSEETKHLTSVDVNENFSSPMPRKKIALRKWESGTVCNTNRFPSDSSLELDEVVISTSESSEYIASEGSINSISIEVINSCSQVNDVFTENINASEISKPDKNIFRFHKMRKQVKRKRDKESKKSRMTSELQSVSLPDLTSDEDDKDLSPLFTSPERPSAIDATDLYAKVIPPHKRNSNTSPPLSSTDLYAKVLPPHKKNNNASPSLSGADPYAKVLPPHKRNNKASPPLSSIVSPYETIGSKISHPLSMEMVSYQKIKGDASPPLSTDTRQSSSQSLLYSDRSFSDSDAKSDNSSNARSVRRKNCLRLQLFNRQKDPEDDYNYTQSVTFERDKNDRFCIVKNSDISSLKANLLIKIFSYLPTRDVCRISKVCQKWYQLYLSLELWSSISITNYKGSNIDDVINILLQRLAFTSPYACLNVKTVQLDRCTHLTNAGLTGLAMRCPELKSIEVASCINVSGDGLVSVLANCPNMAYMNLTGCDNVIDFNFSLNSGIKFGYQASFLELRYVDFSECTSLHDSSLRNLVKCASFLEFLYLRRCDSISNDGIIAVAENCLNLKEVSLNECYNVSDIGVTTLLKRCIYLRYISLAKCTITDVSVKCIAKYSRSLRHLNLRECEAITDESIIELCCQCDRLRSIDLGKCFNMTDSIMYALSQCKRLRRLCVNECTNISDPGLRRLVTTCKKLRHIDLRHINFSLETYIYIKQRCKQCIIQHNRNDFF